MYLLNLLKASHRPGNYHSFTIARSLADTMEINLASKLALHRYALLVAKTPMAAQISSFFFLNKFLLNFQFDIIIRKT